MASLARAVDVAPGWTDRVIQDEPPPGTASRREAAAGERNRTIPAGSGASGSRAARQATDAAARVTPVDPPLRVGNGPLLGSTPHARTAATLENAKTAVGPTAPSGRGVRRMRPMSRTSAMRSRAGIGRTEPISPARAHQPMHGMAGSGALRFGQRRNHSRLISE